MDALLVLTNAAAGSADRDHLDRALAVLRGSAEVEVVRTGEDGALDAALDGRDGRTLVVAGGDGSLHLTVARLHERRELDDTVLGLLPMGTGNDFARSNRIPLDVEDAARVVAARHVRDVDLICDDGDRVVVNNVHLGIGADASRYGARWKKRVGRVGYPIGLLQAAFSDPYRLRVTVDDEVVADGEHGLLEVSIGNGATVGGGLALNPDADPDDGRLDVLVARATGAWRRVTYGVDLARARHPRHRDVEHRLASRVEVSGQPVHLSADGEIEGPITRREWRLLRNAMNVILPS
ncbi:lipid kinase YegS [Microlunatus aurantiacus]|uniref:Lipid kinase YegS n=1 Tax=Microlunatus aurantiacus TaxID=446786 RepID=A0ABP7E221_9ACTN